MGTISPTVCWCCECFKATDRSCGISDSRDLTFLVETGIRAPDVLIERSDVFAHQETLDEVGTDLYGDQAITFYSAKQGKTSMHDTTFGRRGIRALHHPDPDRLDG